MTRSNSLAALLGGFALAAGAATGAAADAAWLLGNNGATLVALADLSKPGAATGTPVTDERGKPLALADIDIRPGTGEIYGYSDATDAVYVVDPATGAARRIAARKGVTDTASLGVDFNNMVDAMRIVTTTAINVVFFPKKEPAEIAAPVTPPAYAAGDANAGAAPLVFGNAYTNAVPAATATAQYGLDAATDSLVTIANNAGTLETKGRLHFRGAPLDVSVAGGFDILSRAEGDNSAYALLTAFGPTFSGQGLFRVPLEADAEGRIAVTLVGPLPTEFALLRGLAVRP